MHTYMEKEKKTIDLTAWLALTMLTEGGEEIAKYKMNFELNELLQSFRTLVSWLKRHDAIKGEFGDVPVCRIEMNELCNISISV